MTAAATTAATLATLAALMSHPVAATLLALLPGIVLVLLGLALARQRRGRQRLPVRRPALGERPVFRPDRPSAKTMIRWLRTLRQAAYLARRYGYPWSSAWSLARMDLDICHRIAEVQRRRRARQ